MNMAHIYWTQWWVEEGQNMHTYAWHIHVPRTFTNITSRVTAEICVAYLHNCQQLMENIDFLLFISLIISMLFHGQILEDRQMLTGHKCVL